MSLLEELKSLGPWKRVSYPALVGFTVLATFLSWGIITQSWYIRLLDGANLLFHEAGHPFFGLFSRRLEVYGGTLGQLTFPLVLIVYFFIKRQTLSFAGSWLWFFQNFFHIAVYVADSRALKLDLVGGGMHDWNEILYRWHIMHYDLEIATGIRIAGWAGMAVVTSWLVLLSVIQNIQAEKDRGQRDQAVNTEGNRA